MTPQQKIISKGDTNPVPIPGFPNAWLTDEGHVWSLGNGRLRKRKPQRGRYYALNEGDDCVTCTVDKLRYCIEHGMSPLTLSRCKLAVRKGQSGLELVDMTQYVHDQMTRNRERNYDQHAEEYMEVAEQWCHNVLLFWRGHKEAAVEMRKTLDRLRPYLVDYAHHTMKISDEHKTQFIIDEVMSETMLRTLERKAVIHSPYGYMLRLIRAAARIIREVNGKTCLEHGSVRIVGGWRKDTMKEIYNF